MAFDTRHNPDTRDTRDARDTRLTRDTRTACPAPDGGEGYDSRLLEAVRLAAAELLGVEDWREHIAVALQRVGQTIGVCRCRLFELVEEPDGVSAVSRYCWLAPGVADEFPDGGGVDFDGPELAGWLQCLHRGEIFTSNVDEANEIERALMHRYDMQAILVAPIEAGGRAWGCLGLCDCHRIRRWTPREIDLLRTVAKIIGAAVEQGLRSARSRQNESVYRSLIRHLPVGLIRTLPRPDSPIIMANPAVARIFGFDRPEAMLDRRVRELFENPEDWREALRAALGGGAFSNRPFTCLRRGGERIWTSLTASVVRGEDALPAYIELVLEDITHRTLAENALRLSEARYRDLVETQTDLVVRLDVEGRIAYANASFVRAVDRESERLVGAAAADFVHPDDVEALNAALVSVREAGRVETVTLRVGTREGWRWMEWEGYRLEPHDDQAIVIQAVGRDVTQRVEAEQALANEQRNLRTLVDTIPDAVYLKDRDGRLLVVNNRFVEGMQRPGLNAPADFVGLSDYDLFDRRTAEDYRKLDLECMLGGAAIRRESHSQGPGRSRWLEYFLAPLQAPGGRVDGMVGLVRDISAQREAELAIQHERRLLRTIIDAIPNYVYMKDTEGRFVLANRAFVEARGLAGEADMLGRTDAEFQSPERREHCRRCDRELIQHGRPILNRERVWTNAEGKLCCHLFNSAPIRDEDGRIIGLIGIISDLSELRRAEKLIQESRARYQDLVESLPLGVCRLALQPGPRLEMANTAAAAMFGFDSPDEFIQAAPACLAPLGKVARGHYRRLLRSGCLQSVSQELRRADGRPWWVLFTATLLRDDDERPLHVDVVLEDITDRKRSELALQQAHNELVNAREVERRRLASELHDSLGQAMVALHMTIQGLSLAAEKAGPSAAALAEPVRRAAGRCGELVREVRQICHGLYPPVLGTLGLEAALSSLSRDFADHVGVTLEFDPELTGQRLGEQVEITLFRIAQEALSNAVRHGRAADVSIAVHREGGALTLTVADNGNGFDPAICGGPGLGLKSMRERASAIGAALTIETAPGEGAKVRLELPPPDEDG